VSEILGHIHLTYKISHSRIFNFQRNY